MKNSILSLRGLSAAVIISATLAACTLETSDNGKLDGFWQLTSLDSLATGRSVDMKSSRVFWSVQTDLLETQYIGGYKVLFRFQNTGDSLLLSQPYFNSRDVGDSAVTNVDDLRRMGVNSLNEHYHIDNLTGSDLTIQSTLLRLHFRKY